MATTLEQQRAADAWHKARLQDSAYSHLAKSVPALIMNGGLLQTLAFLHEKGAKEQNKNHQLLGEHLRDWLARRFTEQFPSSRFDAFMPKLIEAEPLVFQQVTVEAMAWLRWLRQMAPAVTLDTKE